MAASLDDAEGPFCKRDDGKSYFVHVRGTDEGETGERFERVAGRINALAQLYNLLADDSDAGGIDLGVYLSKVASTVMEAHATEGVRLELKVDTWPVSIDIAMPTGLVVNEIMTNALKHAFEGRDGGTITLSSLVDDTGCRVVISDNGIGLPEGVTWPQSGKLGDAIAQSPKDNAKATVEVRSAPNEGVGVMIFLPVNQPNQMV